jgi:hypothetical protein
MEFQDMNHPFYSPLYYLIFSVGGRRFHNALRIQKRCCLSLVGGLGGGFSEPLNGGIPRSIEFIKKHKKVAVFSK